MGRQKEKLVTGSQQLKAALKRKQGQAEELKRVPIPDPIVHATAGTHVAKDGKTYTITYDKPEGP